MHREVQLHRLAERQLGLITRAQLVALGFSPAAVARLATRGVVTGLHRSVYRCAGWAESHEQALLGACLACGDGAALSHRTAGHRWEVTERFAHFIEITVPWERRPRLRGVTVHRSRSLDRADIRWRDGLPITSVDRTLLDLGTVCGPSIVAEALERAVIDRRTTIDHLYATVDQAAGPGRQVAGLRQALDDWLLGDKPPDSVLEPMMARVLHRHRLPAPVFQHEVRSEGRFVARVDFAWPERMVIVEVDGLHWRSTAAALEADLRRQNALVLLGYKVVRFPWRAVVHEPEPTAAAIAEALERAVAA